ncbi:MFS transporter [Serinicoccus sp. LYQ131]|uniref:MFS transporter n=1 Tax=Serinicoccus sp. LYQ131 TaxID=3378797 RepID=UPI003851D4E9
MHEPPAEHVYHRLVQPDPAAEQEFGGSGRVAAGGVRLIVANALQNVGDQVVNAKTVLPWLFSVLGAPAAMVALLVPLRESGSMLPQAALAPRVAARPRRTRVWMVGAAVQGVSTLGMAAAAVLLVGASAGATVLVALTCFALGRALCSIAAKDVQGRSVPKGQRGQVTGTATAISGVAAIAVGLGLHALGPSLSAGTLAAFLVGAALAWCVGIVVYAGIPEEPAADAQEHAPWWRETVDLLRGDRAFRSFVLARALLLVSALAPPFIVTLAVDAGGSVLAGLGSFVIAQGVASAVGGRVFGRLADRSSRLVMVLGSLVASLAVLVVVLVVALAPDGSVVLPVTLVGAYLVISLVHVGVRVARKTYVVDVAEGDLRTRYVAVSNTAMGLVLLVTGAVSAGLALFGQLPALVFLAVLGLLGAAVSWRLPEVSKG